jgi:hypothetical protein
MNRLVQAIAFLLLIGLVVPATAFTADRIEIRVAENGDAGITFDYTLSWIERAAVFLRIADPGGELKRAMESHSGKEVTVTSISPSGIVLWVDGFATVRESADGRVYRTPALDFTEAGRTLTTYWFARFVTVDTTPAVAVIRFPDGHRETLYDREIIPSITHTIGK